MTDYERETIATLRALLDGDIDGECTTDEELVEMWAAHSAVQFASWLICDGLTKDTARGMVYGWAARQRHERWMQQGHA